MSGTELGPLLVVAGLAGLVVLGSVAVGVHAAWLGRWTAARVAAIRREERAQVARILRGDTDGPTG